MKSKNKDKSLEGTRVSKIVFLRVLDSQASLILLSPVTTQLKKVKRDFQFVLMIVFSAFSILVFQNSKTAIQHFVRT